MKEEEPKHACVFVGSKKHAQAAKDSLVKPKRVSIVGLPLERISIVGLPLERISAAVSGKPVRVGLEEFLVRGIEPVHGGNYFAEVRCLTCGSQWQPRRKLGRLVWRWWVCPEMGCNK
jgi:hypothetical protein